MTYPIDKRPEGHAKRVRRPLDPGNPLGQYVCPPCGTFRDNHGVLPDEVTCRRIDQLHQSRRLKAELIARTGALLCQDCNKDQADSKMCHGVVEGKVYCHTCKWRRKKGQEARDFIGADVRCYDCNRHRSEVRTQKRKTKTGMKEYGAMHRNSRYPGQVFCGPCYKYIKRNGRLRREGITS